MCLSDQLCLDLKVVGLIPMLTEIAELAVAPMVLNISQRKLSRCHYCYLHESVDVIQMCCMLVKIIENFPFM